VKGALWRNDAGLEIPWTGLITLIVPPTWRRRPDNERLPATRSVYIAGCCYIGKWTQILESLERGRRFIIAITGAVQL
jgi:hypothetical protein